MMFHRAISLFGSSALQSFVKVDQGPSLTFLGTLFRAFSSPSLIAPHCQSYKYYVEAQPTPRTTLSTSRCISGRPETLLGKITSLIKDRIQLSQSSKDFQLSQAFPYSAWIPTYESFDDNTPQDNHFDESMLDPNSLFNSNVESPNTDVESPIVIQPEHPLAQSVIIESWDCQFFMEGDGIFCGNNEIFLKLISGSYCIPHPSKVEPDEGDAHFMLHCEQVIGIADGSGGRGKFGVDACLYAQELMYNSMLAIDDEPIGLINPAQVLNKAYLSTKANGCSTACIIALTNQGIHAVNLGDGGFIVQRYGRIFFRSSAQYHDFNLPFQLQSDGGGDLPDSGEVFKFHVQYGDVIVTGTDGLFDNLHDYEINIILIQAKKKNLGPQETAQLIAISASQCAHDKAKQVPFAILAQNAGYQYSGGRLDDITVVVSFVTDA